MSKCIPTPPARLRDGSQAKKNGPQAIGRSRGGWNTKIHLVVASEKMSIAFHLSGGNVHDAPEGEKLIAALPEAVCRKRKNRRVRMLMDRAYEGEPVRATVRVRQMMPVVPPKRNRKKPWQYDRKLYLPVGRQIGGGMR